MESVYEVPGRLLTEPGYRDYEDGIAFLSKNLAGQLARAIETYYRLPTKEGRASRMESAQIKKLKDAGMTDFWSTAEQHQKGLAELVAANLGNESRDRAGKIQFITLNHPWTNVMRIAVRDAYRRACPAITATQIEAFAAGWALLAP